MQRVGGVSRYYAEIISHLCSSQILNVAVPIVYSDNDYAQQMLGIMRRPGLYRYRKSGARLAHRLPDSVNRRHFERAADTSSDAILHPTYFNPYILTRRGSHKLVVTVYDMTHERFGNLPDPETVQNKRMMMEAADIIIAISQSTKNDIVELYPQYADKIEIIHLAGSLSRSPESEGARAESPYVLFVGSRAGYKNFPVCARAFAGVLPDWRDLQLVCAGGGPFSSSELGLFKELGIEQNVSNLQVDDAGLSNLYSHATVFIFPSKYEGFGLPALEAMACGVPCLLSSVTSLPEVGGDAALYFDPQGADELAGVLARVLGDRSLAEEMQRAGFNRAAQFTWERTARLHEEVYRSL